MEGAENAIVVQDGSDNNFDGAVDDKALIIAINSAIDVEGPSMYQEGCDLPQAWLPCRWTCRS